MQNINLIKITWTEQRKHGERDFHPLPLPDLQQHLNPLYAINFVLWQFISTGQFYVKLQPAIERLWKSQFDVINVVITLLRYQLSSGFIYDLHRFTYYFIHRLVLSLLSEYLSLFFYLSLRPFWPFPNVNKLYLLLFFWSNFQLN
eukprot:c14592_g1_i1 orf=287-721(-)